MTSVSTKFLSYENFVEALEKELKDVEGMDMDSILSEVNEFKDNELFNTAARIVRAAAEKHTEFHKTISKSIRNSHMYYEYKDQKIAYNHLAYPFVVDDGSGKKKVMVRVFKNLYVNAEIYDQYDEENFSIDKIYDLNCTSWSCPYPLSKFYSDLKSDLEDSNKCKKWQPMSRGIKALKAYTDMTVQKYLTKFTSVKDTYATSDIRDAGSLIADTYMPVEIVIASSVDQIIHAYETGPSSCMKSTSGSADRWRKYYESTKHLLETDPEKVFHPTAFYYHCPVTSLAFAMRGDTCIARTVVYEHEGQKHYTRIYYSDGSIQQRFERTLRELGYEGSAYDEDTERYVELNVEFDIPPIEVDGTKLVPTPYIDEFTNGWKLSWNEDNGVFEFRDRGTKDMGPWLRTTNGYLTSTTVTYRECAHCGNQIRMGEGRIADDGTPFCSIGHANAEGYINAHDSEGSRRLVIMDNTIRDELNHGLFWTNHAAAIARGAKPMLTAFSEPEDDYALTANGIQVVYRGVDYHMAHYDYERLHHNGKVTVNGDGKYEISELLAPKMSNINVSFKTGEFRIARSA